MLLLVLLSNVLLLYVNNEHLMTVELAYETYSDRATMADIVNATARKAKFAWMGYVVSTVVLVLKLLAIAFCINILLLLLDIKLSFKKVLGVVIVAEFVMILSNAVRVIWLLYFADVQTLDDLSLIHI